MLFSLIGKLDLKYVSDLVLNARLQTKVLNKRLHNKTVLDSTMHHGGPCLPGIMRLFVSTDGRLFPCERVSCEIDFFEIGSLDKGFNFNKMRALLNIGKVTKDECINCWNLPNCTMCAGEIDFKDGHTLQREEKAKLCALKKQRVEQQIYEQCVLKEYGYEIALEEL